MISDKFILWCAFLAGLSVMAIELAAARLLAPYFGTSIFVWTNLIAVVLTGLSAGYYFGGKLADQSPKVATLSIIMAIAGILFTVVPWIAKPLAYFLDQITTRGGTTGIIMGSLAASIILFGAPMAFLGAVSPLIIKIRTLGNAKIGEVAGSIFAISTVGSIIGTFLPALWLIPTIGTRLTISIFAIALLGTGLLGLGLRSTVIVIIGIAAVGSVAMNAVPIKTTVGAIYEDESSYQYIQIIDRQAGAVRQMRFDGGAGSQSVAVYTHARGSAGVGAKDQILTSAYFDYYNLLPAARDGKDKNILLIGVAGGTIIKQLEHFWGTRIATDAVELDPRVIVLAQEYFNLKTKNSIHTADGRMFLRRNEKAYDIIIVDAYSREYHIPWTLATKEFWELARSRLTPNGVLSMNMAVFEESPEKSKILEAITNTLAASFPYLYRAEVTAHRSGGNYMIMGANEEIDFNALESRLRDQALQSLIPTLTRAERINYNPHGIVLTDDRAPVEQITKAVPPNLGEL
ncbi:fused MFS/spermidine synthase [Candidatus Wolfebacteria bacterium]|nr:fused MFS/spermidine synthase [Candidatus Wolfebacteria bacterium]